MVVKSACAPMRRLELDAGNTFIKWRLLDAQGRVQARGRWLTAEFAADQLAQCDGVPDRIWLASVAGEGLNRQLAQAVEQRWGRSLQQVQTAAVSAGVRNSYADPARMGVDRWLAMVAAWNRYRQGCWVVDAGSAITVDLLDGDGCHRGGYILPGLRLMQQALLGNTAEVRVDRDVAQDSVQPGTDTSSAVAHGANLLLLSLAQQLQTGIPGCASPTRLFITGGDGERLARLLPHAEHCPDLVMDGLQWALE
ncbi:type III pantothenate kinase [Marinobacterium weihaiense]|uniref:Type III pantothenate kinase n=1 Tax=Marinobacterium weihaiense TaxID=2851016 RepID=A0ABS6MCH2_9GAMM|nr:type III pantothenate kinase [Marinobacterium weihaiense]MBV0934002.1 type III pantothenate kinase [Marinobacterium weihaiense]